MPSPDRPSPRPASLIARTRPKSKSRSISSLPLPESLSMASIPATTTPNRVLSPPRAPVHSPSRLPATNTLSYFPPFETMGSDVEAGPSRPPPRPTHSKGRSLGSLAGLVSWGLALGNPSEELALTRTTQDGQAVEALTRRFTPGKRRVLEPISVCNDEIAQVVYKRRSREVEVEGSDSDEEIEGIVDSPVRSRPTLQLPIPALPAWRFPLPSPPVTSLSPDIPLELFSTEIDNPITSSNSPARSGFDVDNLPSLEECELDEIDTTLSGSTGSSLTAYSLPSTPEKMYPREIVYSPKHLVSLGEKLARTTSRCSGRSSDSKETIRAEGEVTPKAGKVWKAAGAVVL